MEKMTVKPGEYAEGCTVEFKPKSEYDQFPWEVMDSMFYPGHRGERYRNDQVVTPKEYDEIRNGKK